LNTKNEAEIKMIEDMKKGDDIIKKENNSTGESRFYEKLALTIKSISLQSKRDIGKILILGDNLHSIYISMKKIFPNAYYVMTNNSEKFLKQLEEDFDRKTSIKIRQLDIFSGSSLTDFYLEFGKFDLILLFGILNGEEVLTQDLLSLLKKIRSFKKVIKTHQKKNMHPKYLIFTKKNRIKLFGD